MKVTGALLKWSLFMVFNLLIYFSVYFCETVSVINAHYIYKYVYIYM